eukprot:SAG22_NODE_1017_length_6016_cov_40.662667_5_plen_96_part_00
MFFRLVCLAGGWVVEQGSADDAGADGDAAALVAAEKVEADCTAAFDTACDAVDAAKVRGRAGMQAPALALSPPPIVGSARCHLHPGATFAAFPLL